jgi:hypothetical protein
MRHDPTPIPQDDEIAAALAAIRCYIEEQQPTEMPEARPRAAWRAAAILESQGLRPTRNGDHRAWGAADRAARASRWSYGIVGM